MKTYLALLGMLLLAGVSFAGIAPSTGPGWNTLAQTCCQGQVAQYLSFELYDYDYYAYSGGCEQIYPPYDPETIYFEFCSMEGGVWDYYMDVAETCYFEGERSAACMNAYGQFYSRAASARGMFSATRKAYLSAARQSMYSYMNGYCETSGPERINYALAYSGMMYRECMQDPWNCIDECSMAIIIPPGPGPV